MCLAAVRQFRSRAHAGSPVVTALLLALFGGAAILAIASMAVTVKHYAVAAIAVVRQPGRSGNTRDPGRRKHLVYARRHKAQLNWRAKARARSAERDSRRYGKYSAMPSFGTHKTVHNRDFCIRMVPFGIRMAPFRIRITPLSDSLVLE
jgi:hypothetical protein